MSTVLFKNARIITASDVKAGSLLIKDGVIEKIYFGKKPPKADEEKDLHNTLLAPAFVDLHIHGLEGRGTDEYEADAILAMSKSLARQGVSAFCPTLYASNQHKLLKKLGIMSDVMGKETGSFIAGLHLEGPFISSDRRGAMQAEDIMEIKEPLLEEMWQASKGKIKIITAAPELKNFDILLNFAKEHNIIIQAGHTDATYEDMLRAFQKGVNHATHLFNAMSPLHQRAPGATGAALMIPNFSVEVIADHVHVHPAFINFLKNIKDPSKIILVTDSIRPAGQRGGRLEANDTEVIFEDGIFKDRKFENIVGSALTMEKAVQNVVLDGFTVPNAIRAATKNPANLIGLKNKGELKEGYDADILVMDNKLNIMEVFLKGERINYL